MGLFDKVKSVAKVISEEGIKLAGEAVTVINEAAEQKRQQEEERKLAQERAEAEAEALRKEKEEQEIKSMFGCEHGQCAYATGFFFCTCSDEIRCPKKKEHLRSLKVLNHPEFMPYLLDYAIGKAGYRGGETEVHRVKEQFIKDQFPYFDGHEIIQDAIYNELWMGEFDYTENPQLRIFKIAHDVFQKEQLQLSTQNDAAVVLMTSGAKEPYEGCGDWVFGSVVDENHPCFRDVTLFTREKYDFAYSLQMLVDIVEVEKAADIMGVEAFITVDMLFDSNGRLKEAGRGGAAIGETGDTIWNTVHKAMRGVTAQAFECCKISFDDFEYDMIKPEPWDVVTVVKERRFINTSRVSDICWRE